jgi:DNA-binding PadR family transcriptional regulator
MPRAKTDLSPAEYAVLGLLRQKPAYGYELQRQLTGARGLGRVCPVEPAMVYAVLKSLSSRGLIAGRWDSSAYPPKAVYTATETGNVEFTRWLQRPVGRMREVRLDFLVKLYFALQEDRRLARDLVETQIRLCRDYAGRIEREQASVEPDSFDAIVLQSKATAARITREWLEQCLQSLSPALAPA